MTLKGHRLSAWQCASLGRIDVKDTWRGSRGRRGRDKNDADAIAPAQSSHISVRPSPSVRCLPAVSIGDEQLVT